MDSLTRSIRLARLMSGRGYSLTGALLTDTTTRGDVVPLDPATGGELAADADPAWILSTPREASDGHIVRLHWDLSRGAAGGPGIPVLFNHNRDQLLGQWRDLEIAPVDAGGYVGEALIGRSHIPEITAAARDAAAQVRAGVLRSTSIGWLPGDKVRRSDLDTDDPAWRAAAEDECGQPAEGFVMGTAAAPNRLMEASLVTIPAQADAISLDNHAARAMGDLSAVLARDTDSAEAAIRAGSLDRLLFLTARDPRVRSWAARLIRAELADLLREADETTTPTIGATTPTIGDLF